MCGGDLPRTTPEADAGHVVVANFAAPSALREEVAMTCCCQQSRAPLGAGWVVSGRGVRELVRAAWRAYWENRVERVAAEFLRLLDAHALGDLGLERSELDALLGVGDSRQGDCLCHEPRQGGRATVCKGAVQELSVLAGEPPDGKAA